MNRDDWVDLLEDIKDLRRKDVFLEMLREWWRCLWIVGLLFVIAVALWGILFGIVRLISVLFGGY